MDRILKSYSRDDIEAMGPGNERFYLAEDVEKEIGRLKRKLREMKEKSENSQKVVSKNDQWICNGNVPDPDPDDVARGEWGIFG